MPRIHVHEVVDHLSNRNPKLLCFGGLFRVQVGKRAPQAASHTDTSFKSKRVRVSAQSILHEIADGEAVTAKGLGVQVRRHCLKNQLGGSNAYEVSTGSTFHLRNTWLYRMPHIAAIHSAFIWKGSVRMT